MVEDSLLTSDLRTARALVHATICAYFDTAMKVLGVVAIPEKEAISDAALKKINAAICIFWSAGLTVLTPETTRRDKPCQTDGNIPFDDIVEVDMEKKLFLGAYSL